MNYFTDAHGQHPQLQVRARLAGVRLGELVPLPEQPALLRVRTSTRPPVPSRPNDSREDYDDAPSKSTGSQLAIYVRDKFQVGPRVSVEAGLRIEHQSGESDIERSDGGHHRLGAARVGQLCADERQQDAARRVVRPLLRRRAAGLLGLVRERAAADQLQHVRLERHAVRVRQPFRRRTPTRSSRTRTCRRAASTSSRSASSDSSTSALGIGVRYIQRDWGNFIDDVEQLQPRRHRSTASSANIDRRTASTRASSSPLDKRFSSRLVGVGQLHVLARSTRQPLRRRLHGARGLHRANCRQTVDPGLFGGGTFPCSEIVREPGRAGRRSIGRT